MTATTTFVLARRRNKAMFLAVVALIAVALQAMGANPAASQNKALTAYTVVATDVLDPSADVWGQADVVDVALTAQAVTYPQGGGSVPAGEVRALTADGVLYLRIQWSDETPDARGSNVDGFTDAVAVEFPSVASSSVPAICMGQADGGVNIWQWRAANEEGLGDSATDLYPAAQVDGYPSTDDLYFPARELGNPVARSGAGSTENLVAEGFGNLAPTESGPVSGQGTWSGDEWAVVVARDLAAEGVGQTQFTSGSKIDTAFAIWNGSDGDRNGRKSVSEFVQLAVSQSPPPPVPRSAASTLAVIAAVVFILFAVAVVVGFAMTPRSKTTSTPPDVSSPDGTP